MISTSPPGSHRKAIPTCSVLHAIIISNGRKINLPTNTTSKRIMLNEASQRQRLHKHYIFTVAPWTEKPLSETCAETMLPPKGQGLT